MTKNITWIKDLSTETIKHNMEQLCVGLQLEMQKDRLDINDILPIVENMDKYIDVILERERHNLTYLPGG